jgi:hypothetical protein
VRRFRSHTLPEVRGASEDPVMNKVMEVPDLIEWLTEERTDLEDMVRDPAAAHLFRGIPRLATCGAISDEPAEYRMWQGARAMDVLNFVLARRAEELLTDEFPSGAPDASNQLRWLRFNALALQLAMQLDQIKAGAFKTQLLRQITQDNNLGILLCVRSLIEHRALAVWLPQEIGLALASYP